MGKIERFEDFLAWQVARELTRDIYVETRQGAFARDFGLTNQIQRAAVSVMSNIAEGFERNNPNEFFHFLGIAKASCAEVRSQLYVALDVRYLDDGSFQRLMALAERTGQLVGALRTSVAKRRRQT